MKNAHFSEATKRLNQEKRTHYRYSVGDSKSVLSQLDADRKCEERLENGLDE